MLGMFLLLSFTHLGHECQDLLSLCDGYVCVHRLDLGLYSYHRKYFTIQHGKFESLC